MYMNNLSDIFYINLDHRTDRRQEFEAECKRMGIVATRFAAIPHPYGLIGCLKSHLAVLKIARQRKLKNVLIFEDDFQFLVSKEELSNELEKLFASEEPFDVVMLGYNLKKYNDFNDYLVKVLEAQTASAYIVHERFYNTLINLYERTLPELIQTKLWDLYANDQVWKQLQPRARWYAFKTRIGKQRMSYSDTTGKMEEYGV